MSESVILNTSSLSSLVLTQCFELLRLRFSRVYIPKAVCHEFSHTFSLPAGLIVRTLTESQKSRARALGIGPGESEAIVLSMDMQSPLIMDDTSARKTAKKLGVKVIGSLGMVRISFIECLIDRADYESRITAFEQSGRAYPEVIAWARRATKP